ncbi:hypothetical protein ACQPZK_07600 [Micromonospora sp. CA-249363]|uniref:hypothetical protein n=1 Tax=Micromonospora sp. CA-249363 TaxID=3239963 RepID=UPI003D8F2B0D
MPSPPSFAPGTRLTAARLGFLVQPPLARLRQTVAQAIPNITATALTFTTEVVDNDIDGVGGHSTTTNTTRWTARYPGWYRVSGGCAFANNSTGFRLLSWSVNGSIIPGVDVLLAAVSGNTTRIPARTAVIYLNEGDYLELKAYQSSGGSLNTAVGSDEQASMDVLWVSA